MKLLFTFKDETRRKSFNLLLCNFQNLISVDNILVTFQGDLKAHERWYEKLHEWDKALEGYKAKLEDSPQNPELLLSKMRCLEALVS